MQSTIRGSLPLGLLGSVFAAFFLALPALHAPAGEVMSAETIIAPFRDAVYDHTENEEGILSLHERTLALVREDFPYGPERFQAEAMVNYYLGRFYQDIGTVEEMIRYAADLREGRYLSLRRYYNRREEAMAAYGNAADSAKRFLEEAPCAEAHRLYGEILGQMLILGDVRDLFVIGGKARRHVEEALKADGSHTKALIQEASRLAYSPKAYGGNPEKARELYRAALRGGGADTEDLFNIYGGFGMAAFMEGKDSEAAAWFREASTVYPGNAFAAGMAEFLDPSAEAAP